ncbi:hypothetical protein [Streptomyces luteogriseus]|uniref:hypothetical protein n=1 Tax=Streptomyces luteogriseus TaxID=68233 RepID=UPI0037AAD5B5
MSFQKVLFVMVWNVPSSAALRSAAKVISAVLAAVTSEAVADVLSATPAAAVNALAKGFQESAVYFVGVRVW